MQFLRRYASVAIIFFTMSLFNASFASATVVVRTPLAHEDLGDRGRTLSHHGATLALTYSAVQPAVIPSDVGNADPYDTFASISCTSPGNCTAAGTFFAANGQHLPMTQTSTNGIWAPAVPALFTGPLATVQRSGGFSSVSCSAPGNCTAVGYFASHAIIESSTNGVWAPAQVPTFGPTTSLSPDGPNDHFNAVSCSSAGNCTAVGDYANGDGYNIPMTVSSTNGVWADAIPATFQSDFSGSAVSTFNVVSCSSAGNCMAGGTDYQAGGFFTIATNGVWATAVVIPKVNALGGLSCTAPGSCTAAGSVVDSQNNVRAMTVTATNGAFAAPALVAIDPLLEPAYPYEALGAVSCTSPGNCTAVGAFYDGNYSSQPLLETSTNGVWAPPVAMTYQSDLVHTPTGASLISVSCAAPHSCTAAGTSYGADGTEAFTVTLSDGVWSPAVLAAFAPGVSQTPRADYFNAISCSTPGNCTAVGDFTNINGNYPAMTQTITHILPRPNAPTGVRVTFGNANATLTWNSPTPIPGVTVSGFRVTSSPTSPGCSTTGLRTCTVSGLNVGVRYTFTVVALSGQETSLAATAVSGVAVKTTTISSFRFENATLTASLKDQVAAVARDIATHRYKNISLIGYSNTGADSALSVGRARSVQSFLRLRLTALKVRGVTITIAGGQSTTKFTANHGTDHSGNRCVVASLS